MPPRRAPPRRSSSNQRQHRMTGSVPSRLVLWMAFGVLMPLLLPSTLGYVVPFLCHSQMMVPSTWSAAPIPMVVAPKLGPNPTKTWSVWKTVSPMANCQSPSVQPDSRRMLMHRPIPASARNFESPFRAFCARRRLVVNKQESTSRFPYLVAFRWVVRGCIPCLDVGQSAHSLHHGV